MCMIAHLVAMKIYFHNLGCNKSPIYVKNFELGEEIVELQEKLLLISF